MRCEKALTYLKKRSWDNICEKWQSHIPIIDPPGSQPSEFVSNYYGFSSVIHKIDESNILSQEVPGLRELHLWEAIHLLHKASHIISAAELHATRGILTWALSSSYHGALFCAEVVIKFLGVGFPEVREEGRLNNKPILIDFWPEPEKLPSRQKKLRTQQTNKINFFILNNRIDHRNIWSIFNRLLCVTDVGENIWPANLIKALKKLKINEFARQRNSIHYHHHEWIFDDLHDFLLDKDFGILKIDISDALTYSIDNKQYSVILCFSLFRMAVALFYSISDLSNQLNNERILFDNFLNNDERHSIVQNFVIA